MEQKELNIRIDGIDVVSKALYNSRLTEHDVFNHQIITQALADVGKNLAIIFVQIKIHRINDADNILGELTTAMGFIIENLEAHLQKDKTGANIIPTDMENFLKSISISTTRGIMFSEFKGTILHKAILPIIMLDSLKKKEGDSLFEEIQKEEK